MENTIPLFVMGFSYDQVQKLRAIKAAYKPLDEYFSSEQVARLRFVRWLNETHRLGDADKRHLNGKAVNG